MSRLPNITGFYPAAASNFTRGRTAPIRKFCVHHSAGWEQTLRYLWADPARNGSSTLYVSGSVREQYVELEDTAWCNGNWQSNCESISCETRGDWRNGYYDQATLDNLTEVMYQSLKLYPGLQLVFHMDEIDKSQYPGGTACPADLKYKEYAQACWNSAKNRIQVENTAASPATPVNLRVDIPDKQVILIRDTNLWDMSFTSFANARAIKALPKGTVIDVAGVYDHPLSKSDYYLSKWSWDHGENNGINRADCEDYVPAPPVVTPPPVVNEPTVPVTPPVVTPPVVDPPSTPPHNDGSGTLPPLPVDPNGDLKARVSVLEAIVQKIVDFLAGLFSGFKK
jgi:hypothetical protein